MLALLSVPLSGCATVTADTYCYTASPILFGTDATVNLLLENDRHLLTDILAHNETYQRVCNDY